MQKLTPFLWFNDQAEEAAEFYVSMFKNSRIKTKTHYGDLGAKTSGKPVGSVMTIEFSLAGQDFIALNGGPNFKFSQATSFVISCDDQDEIDYYWDKLSDGGEAGQCGWINYDKYGVTWQVIPKHLGELLSKEDTEKSKKAVEAMLKMNKIIIADLDG